MDKNAISFVKLIYYQGHFYLMWKSSNLIWITLTIDIFYCNISFDIHFLISSKFFYNDGLWEPWSETLDVVILIRIVWFFCRWYGWHMKISSILACKKWCKVNLSLCVYIYQYQARQRLLSMTFGPSQILLLAKGVIWYLKEHFGLS